MPAKRYKAIRPFTRTDPRTGVDTTYNVGDAYPGPVDKDYLMSADGPDGKGPLIAEVAASEIPPDSSDSDSSKEQ